MLVSVLASGSKGNATLIKTKEKNILIDVGPRFRYLEEKLKESNITFKDIDLILISHTHTDHIACLEKIIKKASPTIILSELMLKDLPFLEGYNNLKILEDKICFNELIIENIKTSHDTTDSRGYIISENNSSIVQITDTGYLNQKYFDKLKNKNLYIMESNHNVEMLLNGRYPKWLKKRVYSDVGHLSNESCAFYLSKLIGNNTKNIILAHLSEENNTPELALSAIKNEFLLNDIEFNNIIAAKQNEKTETIEV